MSSGLVWWPLPVFFFPPSNHVFLQSQPLFYNLMASSSHGNPPGLVEFVYVLVMTFVDLNSWWHLLFCYLVLLGVALHYVAHISGGFLPWSLYCFFLLLFLSALSFPSVNDIEFLVILDFLFGWSSLFECLPLVGLSFVGIGKLVPVYSLLVIVSRFHSLLDSDVSPYVFKVVLV